MFPDWLDGEIIIKKKVIAIIIAVLGIILLGLIGYNISSDTNKTIVINSENKEASNMSVPKSVYSTDNDKPKDIKVYVVGCVKSPGVVTLKKGQIIKDAIAAAGGPTDEADIYNINLVYELDQNVMLKIKSKNETKEESIQNQTQNSGIEIQTDEKNVVVENGGKQGSKKININVANAQELDVLPGVGASTAGKIINYRENTGKFNTIEEIMNVPGIGKSKFEAIKDLISIN